MSLRRATHEAGNTDIVETSPISMGTQKRKRKRSMGSKNKRYNKKSHSRTNRTRQIRSDVSNSGASENVDVSDHKNEDVDTATVSGIEPQTVEFNKTESDNSEDENMAARDGNVGGTPRKTKKIRMMDDIYKSELIDDIYNNDPDTDSDPDIDPYQSEPDVDLNKIEPDADLNKIEPDVDLNKIRPYIDLNLSPTHQGMCIPYEDDEDLQKNGPKEVEEAAAGNQHAADKEVEEAAAGNQHTADAKDQMLTSRKRKGKMLHYEEKEPSLKTSQGDTSRGVQINNENVRGQSTGAESGSFSPKFRKDASTGRSLQSEIEAHNGGQRNGTKTIQSKDKTVNSQVIDDRSQLMPSKKRSIAQVVNGSSSLGYQPEVPTTPRKAKIQKQQFDQSTDKTSEQAAFLMDIVEMMAKNQHERCFGASENTNSLPGETTNKPIERNSMDETEVLGSEIPRFLQEKKLHKQIIQSRNEGNSSSGAKREGSMRQIDSSSYNFQSRHNSIPTLPEQSHTSKRFPTFAQNREKPTQTEFLGGNSTINGYHNTMLSKNHEQASIRAQFLAESSRRKSANPIPTSFMNREEPSSGAQFLTGTSSRHCGDQITAFSKNQEKPFIGAQTLAGSCSRTYHNQNSTFAGTHDKPSTRYQYLFDSSSTNSVNQNTQCDGRLAGQRYSQSGFHTSGVYQTSQTTSWQNSCRNEQFASPSMKPNWVPLGIGNPQKFPVESKTANKQSPSLELFPNENMNGDHSLKYRDPFANHLEKKRNFELETSKGIKPQYPYTQNERGVQFDKQSMQPVSFFNNETIPATHLLRLMDAGMRPSSTPVNIEENQKFNQHPFLSHDGHQQQELSRFGHSKRNEGLMLPPSSKLFDRFPPGGFSESLAPVLEVASSSAQKKDIVPEVPGSRGDSPAKLTPNLPTGQAQEKGKIKEAPTQSKSSTSSKHASRKNTSGKNETTPICHLQNGLVFTPVTKDSTKLVELEANKTGTVSPQKIRKKEFCMINRNPADFTLPEEIGSQHEVGYGDPKLKKNVLSKERTCRIEPVGNNRKKRAKPTAIKGM
ncbi:hypothetical protein AQUCO_00100402v1 [Aquilegia coerulea]|uniref:Uncharacterized protein n=1 Tax=Aquilegia coerulea TaxID=218851 RepID=A0A2G5FA51_AQUCA|nr:hypothetical protein AQUCO_00100402v1 [Aquilegia coerulea]